MINYKIHKKAHDVWGKEIQVVSALEEVNELSVELAKILNKKRQPEIISEDRLRLVDELADVKIAIDQMIYSFDLGEAVENRKIIKLRRLASILAQENI